MQMVTFSLGTASTVGTVKSVFNTLINDFSPRRNIEGPHITVTTDNGDINVWGDCNSDLSQFFTRSGHVHIR